MDSKDLAEQMYVRVKREKSTLFIGCTQSDTIESICEDVGMILKKDVSDFVLMKTTGNDQKYTPVIGALDGDRTLEELKILQDDVLACVYRVGDGFEETSNLIVPVSTPPKLPTDEFGSKLE
eukprot:CFRG3736T1